MLKPRPEATALSELLAPWLKKLTRESQELKPNSTIIQDDESIRRILLELIKEQGAK